MGKNAFELNKYWGESVWKNYLNSILKTLDAHMHKYSCMEPLEQLRAQNNYKCERSYIQGKMAFMLGHEAIREATEVHTELLTLTTSCRIYNLLEEALARESSKVLKRRGEGKLVSREEKRRLSREEGKGDNRKGRLGATWWGITGVKEAERMEKYGSGNVWAENWNEGEDGERRGNQRSDSTAGGRLSRGASVDGTTQKIHTKVGFYRWDSSNFPAENLFNSKPHLYSHLLNIKPPPSSQKGIVRLATKYKCSDVYSSRYALIF